MSKKEASLIAIVLLIICILGIILFINSDKRKTKIINDNGDIGGNVENSGDIEEKNGLNNEDILSEDEKAQLEYIAKNISLWIGESEEYGVYNYAVTDLDQDKKMEIISSTIQGTGLYTTNIILEVNENNDGFINITKRVDEGTSEPDITVPAVTAYYDIENNVYHYMFDDLLRDGLKYYTSRIDFYMQDNHIIENLINTKCEVVQTEEDETREIVYMDANGIEITESEYNSIEENIFSNYDKKEVNINWITNDDKRLVNLSEEELYELLEVSYSNFIVK